MIYLGYYQFVIISAPSISRLITHVLYIKINSVILDESYLLVMRFKAWFLSKTLVFYIFFYDNVEFEL